MTSIIKKVVISSIAVLAFIALAPCAFAEDNMSFSAHSNINDENHFSYTYRGHDSSHNTINRWDRNIFNHRYMGGSDMHTIYPYNYYSSYNYYSRSFPNFNEMPTVVIIDRDNPQNVLIIGNTSYNGSDYKHDIVIWVSDSVFWKIRDGLRDNDFRDFRFDRDRHSMSFNDSSGFFSTDSLSFSDY